jgi:hypothetical protein
MAAPAPRTGQREDARYLARKCSAHREQAANDDLAHATILSQSRIWTWPTGPLRPQAPATSTGRRGSPAHLRYLSLRRRKQFAMVQPSTTSRIDLGLILPAPGPTTARLESAARSNPPFTHRVRITAATNLDDELRNWLAIAYRLAG